MHTQLEPQLPETSTREDEVLGSVLSAEISRAYPVEDTHASEPFRGETLDPHAAELRRTHAPHPTGDDAGDFLVGGVIAGRYRVKQILKGGMGLVYMCYDEEVRLPVAIKTFQGAF
ncbi:MAG: hypothetical protein HC915_02365 [Anaerolineae bacterium]|nr:hypothetical protein [Anaerolineae bacterium]